MNADMATTLRLAALRDHAFNELREASHAGPDALERIREAKAALQRVAELEREAA